MDYLRLRRISEQVLHSLSLGPNGLSSKNRTLFATVKTTSNEELLVIFSMSESNKKGFLSGRVVNLTKNKDKYKAALQERFNSMGSAGRVYIYGDTLESLPLVAMSMSAGNEVIRRSVTTVKNFNLTDKRLDTLASRRLDSGAVAFAHGTPNSADEIARMGFPGLSLEKWQRLNRDVETRMKGQFGHRIDSKEKLLLELSRGNHDVVFVVTHAEKGKRLFLGGEEISFDELKSLPDRIPPSSRPRTAVLFSCFAGDLSEARVRLFRQDLLSLAEILVNKNFFDEVFAPRGEIGEETLDLLPQMLTRLHGGLNINLDGLLRIAAVPPRESGERN
jgi:hypothetical protein